VKKLRSSFASSISAPSSLPGPIGRYRGIVFIASLLLAILAYASLFTGASYLHDILPGGVPFGNVLTAIGLCSASWASFILTTKHSILRFVSLVALIASLAWLPVSFALAGNLALNFVGSMGSMWLAISALLLLSVMLLSFSAIFFSVVAWYKRKRSA